MHLILIRHIKEVLLSSKGRNLSPVVKNCIGSHEMNYMISLAGNIIINKFKFVCVMLNM